MKILEVRILPPLAVGRLGASKTPLEAFDLGLSPARPLDFRVIEPRPTLEVDPETGAIAREYLPNSVTFKDAEDIRATDGQIRPVAPFLEVFAVTDAHPGRLVPLTTDLLQRAGLGLGDLHWDVRVGNIKIFRRTGDPGDKIEAQAVGIRDHAEHRLDGHCDHFLPGRKLPLGTVRFIAPTPAHPGIRLRFVPAAGKVYGSSLERHVSAKETEPDPVITCAERILYDDRKGTWRGYKESPNPHPGYTNPAQIFAGYSDAANNQVSWGYVDDECDGVVEFSLRTQAGHPPLVARAHIGAGPPAFAPDTLPVRVVTDELEQILLGPDVDGAVPLEEAEELVRRALETIRLMNTTIMNGNMFEGRWNVASTMVRQDTNDFNRLYEPIMASSIVDNLALQVLHDRVFNGLGTGAAAWFAQALRRPEEIGDLSSDGRRKMPALMRGADGRGLCLTRRQINTVIQAAAWAVRKDALQPAGGAADSAGGIDASDLAAQLHHRGLGNPFSVLPRSAISNCFPGLEFDFRNLWRRAFQGITLSENNNYVVDAAPSLQHLKGRRLVAVDGHPTMVATTGPVFPQGDPVPLKTTSNPNGVSFMEWSNSLATVLQKQGQAVVCHFTPDKSDVEVVVTAADLAGFPAETLTVNRLFDGATAAFAPDLLQPGELTQGLCAPWQNDYRECACYYWAASRPDFVNVVPGENGLSTGDMWMARRRTGQYIPDDRKDSRLLSYDDLFRNWQGELHFIIQGRDALASPRTDPPAA